MKLGFIAVNDLPGIDADARFAAEHGFAGLEFNFWHHPTHSGFDSELDDERVRKMRQILDAHGVKAASFGLWGSNHISLDPAERTASLDRLDRAIRYAEMLGAEVLITGGGQIEGASLDENVAAFVEVFPPYLEKAQAAGLIVALYAVHGNSFFDRIEAYEKVWAHMPEVGIKLDPANILHHGDAYLPILRDHGDHVYHVHVKEHLYLDGELASQPAAGMGDIEWGKVMAFLYEHGYQGYLIIEPHGPLWGRPPLREVMLLLTLRTISQFLI
ncbi:MAG: sugar phosphate isomerase/epimerase [Anaerolineae bacterium]|nr:sugar phosphate isomerase/epimerase [Anaerolineae bacterium]